MRPIPTTPPTTPPAMAPALLFFPVGVAGPAEFVVDADDMVPVDVLVGFPEAVVVVLAKPFGIPIRYRSGVQAEGFDTLMVLFDPLTNPDKEMRPGANSSNRFGLFWGKGKNTGVPPFTLM